MRKLAKEFKSKTMMELGKQRTSLVEEIAKLRLSEKAIPQKDTNLLMKKRKQLAVLLTVLTEKKETEELKK